MNEAVVVDKMNLVLAAAGHTTKLYSFEQLAQGAPVLFINTFEPLFEHGIRGLNLTPANLSAHESNCNLLLGEISHKVEPDRLQNTSGRKLVSGDKHTIAVLVDIYWERSEYMRTRFDEYLSAPPKVIHPKHRLLKKDSSKKSGPVAAQPAGPDHQGENPQEVIQNLQQYVATLEQKLENYVHDPVKSPDGKGKRRASRERGRGRKATDVERARQDAELDIKEDESDSVTKFTNRERQIHKPKLRPGSAKTRPKRPSSAPAKRAPVAGGMEKRGELRVSASGRPVSAGLVSASAHEKPRSASSDKKPRPWSSAIYRPNNPEFLNIPPESEPVVPHGPSEPRDPFDPSIHTFDMRSGRRILIVDSEKYKTQQRNESMGIVKEMEDFRDHNQPRSSGEKREGDWHPPEPTKPEWPSARTEKSVRDYVKKTKVARVGPDKPPPGTLPPARLLAAYGSLQDCDMLITVEHCTNCQYHNTTLRHDEDQYRAEADTMLRTLANAVHEHNPCLRLGVFRFAANVTPKSRDSDVDSRIGAFEVQIAYRDMFGDLVKDMLHSKLASRRWPSKSVTQKRLSAFLSKAKISQHKSPGNGDHYDMNDADVGYATVTCPTGMGQWAELEIADPSWSYVNSSEPVAPAPTSRKGHGKTFHTGVAEVAGDGEGCSIDWVFDARQCGDQALFSCGEKVWVHKFGGERHPICGTVLKADGRNAAMERVVTVQLNYVDTSVIVPESHCESIDSFHYNLPSYSPGEVPVHLQALFVHGGDGIKWHSRCDSDNTVKAPNGHHEHHLCRKTIFQHLKEFAMNIEKAKRSRGTFLVPGLKPDDDGVDLQLCYSEHVISWICEQDPDEDGNINMDALVRRLAPVPSPKKSRTSTPKTSPRESADNAETVKASPRGTAKMESVDAENMVIKKSPRDDSPVPKSPRPLVDISSPLVAPPSADNNNEEPKPHSVVAGSVRNFVHELLNWCERDAPQSDVQLSPRAKLKRNTSQLRKLFTVDGAGTGDTKSLDVIQFSLALEKLGFSCTTDVLMGLLATFDDDGNGMLQYDELVTFLSDESPEKYSMGDIWVNFRTILIGDKVHKVGELGEELFGRCKDDDEQINESDFIEVLNKFSLLSADVISKNDQKTLVSRFSVKKTGSSRMSFLSSSKCVDVGKFLAWLNPVDVHRTSKRVAKSIDWYVSRQTTKKRKENVVYEFVSSLVVGSDSAHPVAADLEKTVSIKKVLEALYSYQVPMSRAEGRAFSKHFGHKNGNELKLCECAAILTGDLIVHSELTAPPASPPQGLGNKAGTESNAFDFSGEFDSSPRKGITSVERNTFDLGESFERDGDQMGTPQTGKRVVLDMCVDMLEVSGPPLLSKKFDRVSVVLKCGKSSVKSSFSSSRQKGTDTRLLDVKDGRHTLHLSLTGKAGPELIAELHVMDEESGSDAEMAGSATHSLSSSVDAFNNRLEGQTGTSKLSLQVSTGNGTINILINVHFVEAKSSVASRIRKMSSKDLGEFRFQPLNNDLEDEDEAEQEAASHLPMALSFGLSSLENPKAAGGGTEKV